MSPRAPIRYISAKLAQQIDEELMSASGAFSLDQLMELAGLACAQALAKSFPVNQYRRVMVCCGPGNQGGDGLVAARHLHHLSYAPTIFLPKPGKKDIYQRLLRQCENLRIPVLKGADELEKGLKQSDVIMDAIFGFSFKPPIRRPFHTILDHLRTSQLPILSIDIPSGWDVEAGRQKLQVEQASTGDNDEHEPSDDESQPQVVETFEPEVLISLTVPKEGVKEFKGRHWLGGRFVPDELAAKYELNIPPYEGLDQIVELADDRS